jgi:peptidoglycan/LPS O-acetylase OafA/YrhL
MEGVGIRSATLSTPNGQAPDIRSKSERAGRLAALDIGRAAACWYVMLFHGAIDAGFAQPILGYGYSGVQFFMMLSGYVLARPYLETEPRRPFALGRYAVGRITRIVPPYYVVVSFAAAMVLLGHGSAATVVPRRELGWHVFTHLAFIHTFFAATQRSLVSVLWSMGLEWQYYVILPVLLIALRGRRVVGALAIFAAVVAATALTRWSLTNLFPGHLHLLDGLFLARMTEFAAGVLLACLFGQGWSGRSVFGFALVVGGGSLLFSRERELMVQGSVLVVFALLRVFGPAVARSRLTRILQVLGEVSYSTYLVHTIAGKATIAVLGRVTHAGVTASPWPHVLCYALGGQAAGFGFYLAIERPITRAAASFFSVVRQPFRSTTPALGQPPAPAARGGLPPAE